MERAESGPIADELAKRSLARLVVLAFSTVAPGIGPTYRKATYMPAFVIFVGGKVTL